MTDNEIELAAEVKRLKEQLRIGIVSGSFCSETNEDNKKALTNILYKHMCTVDSCVNEIDFEEVVKDIMEYI